MSPEPAINLEEDTKILADDDLDVLSSQNYTMVNVYLGAFCSNILSKQKFGKNTKIHRDHLPPPPATWKDLIKHPHKDEIPKATHLELNQLMKDTLKIDNSYQGHKLPLKWI